MNFHEKPVMHVGEVGLKVMNLPLMAQFYKEVIGFDPILETAEKVQLGVDGKVLLNLETWGGFVPKQQRYAGLYHFAILLPSRKELGKALLSLHSQGIPLGSSDHLVSEALYLSDPEGNGIEIYYDRSFEKWEWHGDEVLMAVDPIDAEGLVEEAQAAGEMWSGLPSDTVMGHIHLHVSNLADAKRFYVEGLGFEVVAAMGEQALFLADQKYHHHIGVNVWNGVGIPALPKETAGLGYYTLMLESEEKRNNVAARLKELGAEVIRRGSYTETMDPSGNCIRLLV